VANIAALSLSADEQAMLSEQVVKLYVERGDYKVVDRRNMDYILQEQGFQQSGACGTQECTLQIGQVLGVEQMVTGSVGKLGSVWIFNLQKIEVASGKILNVAEVRATGTFEKIVFDALDSSVRTLEQKAAPLPANASTRLLTAPAEPLSLGVRLTGSATATTFKAADPYMKTPPSGWDGYSGGGDVLILKTLTPRWTLQGAVGLRYHYWEVSLPDGNVTPIDYSFIMYALNLEPTVRYNLFSWMRLLGGFGVNYPIHTQISYPATPGLTAYLTTGLDIPLGTRFAWQTQGQFQMNSYTVGWFEMKTHQLGTSFAYFFD